MLVLLCICVCVLTACNKETSNDTENNIKNTNETKSYVESASNNTINGTGLYDVNILDEIKLKLEEFDITSSIVGYNDKNQISVFLDISGDPYNEKRNVFWEKSKPYFFYYFAYIIMDEIPLIDNLCLAVYDELFCNTLQLRRETFNKHRSSDLLENPITYFEKNDFEKYFDMNIKYDEWNVPDTFEVSTEPIDRILKILYGDKLIDYQIDWAGSDDALGLEVFVECDPNDIIKEFSYRLPITFIYTIGVYETQYWNNFINVHVHYVNHGDVELTIAMGDMHYNEWEKNGQKLANWWKDCFFRPEDYKKQLENMVLPNEDNIHKNIDTNIEYEDILNSLKEYEDIEILVLEKDELGYNVVLSLDCLTEEELLEKQFNVFIDLMNLPIQSIWFYSYANNEIYVSSMDRERYNELTFLGQDIKDYFKPEDWPIISNIYWSEKTY